MLYDWASLDDHGKRPACGVRDCENEATWVVVEDEPDDAGRFIGRLVCGEHFRPIYEEQRRERERA